MNAGTNCGEIGDVVHNVRVLNDDVEPDMLEKSQIGFGYRAAPELQQKTILGCSLQLHHESHTVLRETRQRLIAERARKQPIEYPSCGSVFKRPPNHYVGKMVQDLGLKGFRYGNAMISEQHGGFIVNLGHAKASHVEYLIKKIQHEVHAQYGVELETEVRYIGFD
jgi:UDP-N-acetylmuramate dehydrogenase